MTSLARLLAPHVAADPARAALRPEVPAQAPAGVRVLVVGGHSAHEPQTPLLDSAADEALPTWDDGQPAVMLLTSGSTGDPKAVVHSHRSALAWIHFLEALPLTASDKSSHRDPVGRED